LIEYGIVIEKTEGLWLSLVTDGNFKRTINFLS
jgi:hypothetical protein